MGRLLSKVAVVVAVLLFLLTSALAQPGHGNIYLTGHDLELHCAFQPPPNNSCNGFKMAVLFAVAGAPDKTKPVLFLDQGSPTLDGASQLDLAATKAGLTSAGISWVVVDPTSVTFTGGEETPPLPLTTTAYSAIVFASDFSCGAGFPGAACDNNADGETAINNRSADIASFFAAGGGLVYLSAGDSFICTDDTCTTVVDTGSWSRYYNSVPSPFFVVAEATSPSGDPVANGCLTNAPTGPCFQLTAAGISLGLTNIDANCCFSHNSFVPAGGEFGSSNNFTIAELDGNETPQWETLYATGGPSVTLNFSPSNTPETQIGTVGVPTAPDAQSLALTVASVINPITVTEEFHYEPTELSTGHNGVGVADGICERSSGATEFTDFDCRLADGGFVYQTLGNGDQVVPHIIPSHDNLGVWVRVLATRVSDGLPAVPGVDYTGPVEWYYAWNANPPLFPSPNPEYLPGWNNLNPQFFDRHGDDPDIAFKFNITTYAKFNCNPTCVGTADPGIGGKTPTFNDVVPADIPNPPTGQADVVERLVPVPGVSLFSYIAGFPMLVAFELEKTGTEIPDTTAVTFPHNVSAAVLDPATGLPVAVPTFPGFPKTFTYNPFFKLYYIFLSPAPLTPGKTYQLQINSDLFPKPVNANIVVRKSFF